ncbi:hypothetical protein [Deinococcus sp. UYEF24]
MRRRERGDASATGLLTVALPTMLLVLGGHTQLMYAALRDGPTDGKQFYALMICSLFGCLSQLGFLLSQIGNGVPLQPGRWIREVLRWLGEIIGGGLAAYIVCVAFLRYGPDVELSQLVVPAIIGGFAGWRLFVVLIQYANGYFAGRFKLPTITWSSAKPPDPPAPPAPPKEDSNAS